MKNVLNLFWQNGLEELIQKRSYNGIAEFLFL